MPLYNSGKADMMSGAIALSADALAGTLRVILLSASYTGDIDAHTRYTSLSAHEVSVTGPVATGYSSGGQAISASVVISADNGNDRCYFDAADNTWTSSTITARYAAIIKQRASGSNKELDNVVGYLDFGSAQASSNGSFTISWNSAGIILLT